MAEVLSQSQIDALLNSMQDGNLAEPEKDDSSQKVRDYDFYSPKKFTKDRLKLLDSVYENYARLVSSRLNSLLRLTCEVELATVEEQRYHEFSNALSEGDVLLLMEAHAEGSIMSDPVIMHATSPVILSMVDRILGGSGDDVDQSVSSYTEIELSLYENLAKHIIPLMKDSWADYLEIDFTYQKMETNPSLVQVLGMDEIIVIIVLDIALKDIKGKLNICLPGNLLVSVFNIFDKVRLASKQRESQDEKDPEEIMDAIRGTTLDITAKLGETQILLSDLFNMQVGDVINLSKPKDSEVYLYIEDQPWFKGKLGVQKQNMAVKISSMVENL